MILKNYFLCVAVALAVTATSCNKSNEKVAFENKETFSPNFPLAKTNAELEKLRTNKTANLVRTQDDFNRIVHNGGTPLNKLDKETLDNFRKELVVREGVGIVGFNYGTVYKKLSEEDFAEVMAMFGLDAKEGFWGFSKNTDLTSKMSKAGIRGAAIMVDYMNNECVSPHNCKATPSYICLTGC